MKIDKEMCSPPLVYSHISMEVDLENLQPQNHLQYSEGVLVQFPLQKCIIAYLSLMHGVNGIFCNMD